MSRNTPAELRAYASIPTTTMDATLQLYLDTASLIVDDVLTPAGYNVDRLKLIELNLAAHFATNAPFNASYSSGMLESIKIGSSEERYSSLRNNEYGIATSIYGQQAMALDTLGILASKLATKPIRAIFEVY